MSVANDFNAYKRELDLIVKQNPIECELYSIIAAILREMFSSKYVSIRDVSALAKQSRSDTIRAEDRKYDKRNGTKAVADFLVMDPSYTYSNGNKDLIYGCVEAKSIYVTLNDQLDDQLTGELETFNKLLYTNGLKWIYYELDKRTGQTSKEEVELGTYFNFNSNNKIPNSHGKISGNDDIKWNDENAWNALINMLEKINWRE